MKNIRHVLISGIVSATLLFILWMVLPERSGASAMLLDPAIDVSPGYSLVVDPDSTVEYVHTITNTGNVDALLDFQLSASEGWPVELFNAAYPEGTMLGGPLPLDVGATMTMGVRLTAPVTASGGVVNLTTLTVTLLYEGAPFTQVAVENTAVVRTYIYLPLLLRYFVPPLTNGDFSDGLAGWNTSGILGTAIAFDPSQASNPVARLGNPDYACWDGVPIGYAAIRQHFSAPPAPQGKSVHLVFRYRIYTNDRNIGLTDEYDTFDVIVNGVLHRRYANQDEFDRCNVEPYDLGWRAADIDLGAGGILVDLSLEVHNRSDSFYNTYVFVDDVRVEVRD